LIFLCFGDSLTAGYPGYNPHIDGVSRGNGNIQSQYEYWLKKYCIEYLEAKNASKDHKNGEELIFINKGVPGDTSSGLLYRVERDLLNIEPKPDYSIIIIGTNDLGWASSTDKIFKNIKKLHSLSRENGIISIGGLIPPVTRHCTEPRWERAREKLNENLYQYFNKNNIKFTEHTYMMDNKGYLKQDYTSGDGVHFSVAGYHQMGYSIFQNVLKYVIDQTILGKK